MHCIQGAPIRCHLLKIPFELRAEIFTYLLPTTINRPMTGTHWIPGTTALLAVSKQIHDEAASLLYGRATFTLEVLGRVGVVFKYKGQRRPWKWYSFPSIIGQSYCRFIRKIHISVVYFEGLFHFLAVRLRNCVRSLSAFLKTLPNIRVKIRWVNDACLIPPGRDEEILEPFLSLESVRSVSIEGQMSASLQRRLGKAHVIHRGWGFNDKNVEYKWFFD